MDAGQDAKTFQQTGGGSLQTGNPQNIPVSNLQPQASSIQNAGEQSATAIAKLDQGKGIIRVNGVPVTTQEAKVTTASTTPAPQTHINPFMYVVIFVATAAFIYMLTKGLFKDSA